jgi:hypothetical protein
VFLVVTGSKVAVGQSTGMVVTAAPCTPLPQVTTPVDLTQANLTPADAVLMIAAHASRAQILCEFLDPTIHLLRRGQFPTVSAASSLLLMRCVLPKHTWFCGLCGLCGVCVAHGQVWSAPGLLDVWAGKHDALPQLRSSERQAGHSGRESLLLACAQSQERGSRAVCHS